MKKLQNTISEYLAERKWSNLHPADLAKSVSIESSELLELFQWGREEVDDIKKNEALVQKIKDETADVLIYAIQMGVMLDYDIEESVLSKLDRVKAKYPAKDLEDAEFYQKQKQAYREGGSDE